jgi:TolB-like protein/Tfp pilus assembly protein PilF
MGEVYRATDTKLGREVALKVLPAEMAASPERLERFQREAKALAALDHAGIVTVYSVEEADGVHFLTMQLVEGQSLDKRIPEGGMAVDAVRAIGKALAEALAAAHEKGIVHRDLKPANVVASESGSVMGTVPYMSPEQVSGRTVDTRTDVYSLGVILYEMASGRRPFAGHSSAELASAILRDAPPALTSVRPDLPESLARVVSRCLEKDPASRFQSMRAVREALAGAPGDGRRRGGVGRGRRLPSWTPWIAVVLALVLGAVYLGSRLGTPRPGGGPPEDAAAPKIRSIAVLPLDNYSGDASQDYFAEGMTDELTADLARISQLRVISRGSAMRFRGDSRPPTPEIAKVLDVDAVVEGSVLRSGDKVRITAQLIDARADRHLWAKSFEGQSKDVLSLQAGLASAIAGEIHVQLTPAEQSRLGSAGSVDPEAYDAYLKGRYFFNRPSDENLKKAIERFEEAIAIAPDFAPAHSGLSDAVLWAGYNEGFLTASDARSKARDAALKAVELDEQSAEAHASLATFKLFYQYDWKGCEREFRRAIDLNPNYAFAHDQFALALAFQGRFDESIAETRRAAELDPQNPQVPIDGIFAPTWKGDVAAARSLTRRSAELDPTFYFPAFADGWIDVQTGQLADAILHLERAKSMGSPAFASAWLAYAYAASGDRARAAAEAEQLKKLSLRGSVTAFNLALVALGQGDRTRAVSYLEQAYAADSQWLGWLGRDRAFDPLRADPRFLALLKTLGFGEPGRPGPDGGR